MKFKLPEVLHSSLGNLKVTYEENLDEGEDRGQALLVHRVLKVDPAMDERQQAQTFWHEAIHYALFDSGVHNVLQGKQEEAVCDAVGSFLAALMDNGQLKLLKRPKK